MIGSDQDQLAGLASPATAIFDALRDEIVSGVLAPDSSLGQEQLASRFGVSRMPVREAIWQLEALGFVTIEPNRRARVAAASRADFVEIFDMRLVAECLAIRRAIPELSNAQIDRAEAIQKQIEGASGEEFGVLNAAFHMMLYRAAPQPRLLAHVAMLGNAADRYRSMTRAAPSFREKSDREHYEMLAACRSRDTEAAVDCLTRHIGDARDALAPLVE